MSSDDTVLRVEHVSKCFQIYKRPADRLKQLLHVGGPQRYQEFWALNDVSFEVGRGQTVGIIGENGSGKSTLLQIIAGTMYPTSGSVYTVSRPAALLELGSGFNPEFTGRENIYLNGKLLGVSTAAMHEKFDEIVSFANIGIHLDQPVKTYSSGMVLRLAFAVQIAVESEIIIIDEALAVGDARFQKKCFKRLEELKAQGTTILFVSHAVELVRSFCDLGLVLNKGKTEYWGNARSASVTYLGLLYPSQTDHLPQDVPANTPPLGSPQKGDVTVVPDGAPGSTFGLGGAQLDWLKIGTNGNGQFIQGGQTISIRCHLAWDLNFIEQLVNRDNYARNIGLGLALTDKKGAFVFGCNTFDAKTDIDILDGKAELEFTLTCPHLAPGQYFLTVDITIGNVEHHIQLKWYDSLLQLECTPSDKKAFGMIAVDYAVVHLKEE